MPARAPDSVLPCCMRPSPCPSRAHVPHPARFARPASMRPGGLGSSSPASAAHRSLRDRRENHLNSTTIKPGLHFGKPGRFHTSRAITPSAGSQGSKRFAQRCNLSSDIKGAACATGRALPPLAQSQLAGIPRFEAVCVRGVRHPLPQGEWHAAPSYTWGSKRLNASTKRVSSGGLPPTPTWSQRRDWTRAVGASLRSRARRRRLLRRLRPGRRHVPGAAPWWTKRLLGTPLQSVFSPQLTNYRSYLGRCSEPNNKRVYAN